MVEVWLCETGRLFTNPIRISDEWNFVMDEESDHIHFSPNDMNILDQNEISITISWIYTQRIV